MNNTVVYTCITQAKDTFEPYTVVEDGIDYILFTDGPVVCDENIIEIRPVKECGTTDPAKIARYHKIMCHEVVPKYETSIWLDGNIDIKMPLRNRIRAWLRFGPMAMFAHPEGRKCIYQELRACLRLKKDHERVMKEQVNRYISEAYPEAIGLAMTGILIRRNHDKQVKAAMEEWWEEIQNGSVRDQLSWNYVAWKRQFRYVEIQEEYYLKMFSTGKHKRVMNASNRRH